MTDSQRAYLARDFGAREATNEEDEWQRFVARSTLGRLEDGTAVRVPQLTVRETAEMIGLSPGRVHQIEQRALERIREALETDSAAGDPLERLGYV